MNRQSLTNLQKVLATLYEDEDSIRRIVQNAGLATAAMRINNHALNSWYSVLHEAEKHSEVDQLLRTVAVEYPNNQPFHKAYADYRQATGDVATPPLLRRWRPVLLTTLLLVGTSGWYWNVYHSRPAIATATPLVVASPTTATPRPQQTPTATLTPTPTVSATPASPTTNTASADIATAPSSPSAVTATLTANATLDLYVLDEGPVADTYLIKGARPR